MKHSIRSEAIISTDFKVLNYKMLVYKILAAENKLINMQIDGRKFEVHFSIKYHGTPETNSSVK